jgi:hypothetical protein
MGRRIEHNRRISNDRVRKVRKQKSKILIAAEGKNKTEKTYFSNFEDGKKSYNITYARGNNTDPLKLVKMLIKEIDELKLDLQDDDVAYCIFDTDVDTNKNKIIEEAIQLARKNNIKIITSSPCFELWFLLHYDYTTANMDNEEVIKRLKEYYPKYAKNINIYPDIIKEMNLAINRAKKLEKYQIDNNRRIGTVEANPNTEVHKMNKELEK